MPTTTKPATVTVVILSRVGRKPIAEVTVPRPSGRTWLREAYSAAVRQWRREANDWATAVITERKVEA